MAIMKEAKTLTFGDTQYVVVDAEAREKIAELEQSANETLPALKQQIETHSSDNNAHSDIRNAIPTKVSQLANDSQFITQESDPTVPSWAKQETKPEYTAMEVGADTAGTAASLVNAHAKDTAAHADIRQAIPTKLSELSNDTGYLTGFTETDPTVPSWAKQPNKPSYTATEVGAEPAGTSSTVVSQHNTSNVAHTDIRNEVKALNDEFASHEHNNAYDSKGSAESALTEAKSYTDSKTANLASNASVSTSVNNHNTSTAAHGDIRDLIAGLTSRLNALADSDDITLDQMSEVVAYIKANKNLIDSITTSKVNVEDIINNLTTNVANKPLSAAQGVVLKGLIDSVSTSLSNYQPKGNYALKSELPTKVSQLSNDSGYLTEHQDISGKLDSSALPTAINTALAQAKQSGDFKGDKGDKGDTGATGANGKDGTSATHSWNGTTLSITTASGTTSANLKGDKGDKGDAGAAGADGKDGKTPVKGTDYFTEADKQEVAERAAGMVEIPDSAGYVVQDTAPDDTSVMWVDTSDNTNDGFQEAVNMALAQAKASGEFDGVDGKDGKDGVNGKTPVKGTDYFTAADKAEMVNAVISALPVYAGEVV